MAGRQRAKERGSKRRLLARPLDSLCFLLPLIIFYEVAAFVYPVRVISFEWLHQFLELFGHVGVLAPGLAVLVILLCTHWASEQPWRVNWHRVGMMYAESILLAIPLLAVNRLLRLAAGGETPSIIGRIATGIGAGIYEELVFRMIFVSIVIIIGVDLMRRDRTRVAVVAVALSSLAFAAHHYPPIGGDPFTWPGFVFRAMAGAYLAAIFWFRGYGPAAGTHAAYNVALVFWLG